MRRIIKLVVAAIIAAALVHLGAPAPASAEGAPPSPYTVKFIRDKNCANSGTFIIRGVPGKQRLQFAAAWTPDIGPPFSPVYGGTSYTGKGGSRATVWRKHFSASMFYGKMPKTAFQMNASFQFGRVGAFYGFEVIVPACK